MRPRTASQAFIATWVVDAALFDPPATGTGGKRESPSSTVTSETWSPRPSATAIATVV